MLHRLYRSDTEQLITHVMTHTHNNSIGRTINMQQDQFAYTEGVGAEISR